MTSDLQTPRYDQLIRRAGGIIGPGSKVSEALTELFPVIDVENLPGELYILTGTNLCFGSIAPTGAVGESARAQLFNPVGSGKLMTVTLAIVSVSTPMTVRVGVPFIPLTTGVGTERFRDARLGSAARPVGQIRQDSTVALTDATAQFRLLANTPILLTDGNGLAVLSPGSGLEVGAGTFATTIWVTFEWRERLALDSELNLP